MTDQLQTSYQPDYVSPPGETLRELLEEQSLPQRQLAVKIGVTPKHINSIVSGSSGISAEIALGLEKALGVPARFWLSRDAKYQEFLAREQERDELYQHIQWVKRFPLKEMVNLRYIRKYEDSEDALQQILRFFGLAHPVDFENWWDELRPTFRISLKQEPNQFALAAWLRQGELLASQIDAPPFDARRFEQSLESIRELTLQPPQVFQPRLTETCRACGVIVEFVPELPKSFVCGATRWVRDHPLIQLSLRYKTEDMLWFAFFHEACHVLRHPKRKTYLQDGSRQDNEQEEQANRFAANKLIPPKAYKDFARHQLSAQEVLDFASEVGIAPGIVVGRLQHDGCLPFTHLNRLKASFNWVIPE